MNRLVHFYMSNYSRIFTGTMLIPRLVGRYYVPATRMGTLGMDFDE